MQDKEYRINDNLPESLNTDNMHERAKTVDEALRKIDVLSEIVNLYPHIDSCQAVWLTRSPSSFIAMSMTRACRLISDGR